MLKQNAKNHFLLSDVHATQCIFVSFARIKRKRSKSLVPSVLASRSVCDEMVSANFIR